MKEVWMDDVNSMALKLSDIIKQEWGVDDVNKEEQIFIDLASMLERYSNGEYRNHN
jgi:cell division septal protein FtsQ